MPHEFDSGFFVSKAAWHGLGNVLKNPPTTKEGIIQAGLDWKVLEEPIYNVENSEAIPIPGYKSLVRDSDRKVLGVVGERYQPLQNEEAFAWFDPLLHEGDVTLEAAGALKGGKRIWVLAKINQNNLDVADGDQVCPYLLLHNSHDGSTAIWLQFTIIRIVCWNTLSAAASERHKDEKRGKAFRIRHGSSIAQQLSIAHEALNFSKQRFTHTVQEYRAMAKKSITRELFEHYIGTVLETEEPTSHRAYSAIENNFLSGRGNQGKTVWDAYNGITEWTDHQRGRSAETRLESAWFGESQKLRTLAHEVALSLL